MAVLLGAHRRLVWNSSLGVTVPPQESGRKWISLASNYKGPSREVLLSASGRDKQLGVSVELTCKEGDHFPVL